MDDIDRADRINELERTASIERARAVVADRPGPASCLRCGLSNDRARQGFGACTDCTMEAG